MIVEFIRGLGGWSWFIIGLLLLTLELATPGTFFLWFGVAALVVGSFALMIDMPWQLEVLAFAALALTLLLIGRRYFSTRSDAESDAPGLNEQAARHRGKKLVLEEPIQAGTGRAKIGDTLWRVEGEDLPAGTKVIVAETRGATLLVVRDTEPN